MKSAKQSASAALLNQANTIDKKHTEMLDLFHDNETRLIPSLLEEIEVIKNKIKSLTNEPIEIYLDLRDKILSIKSNIKQLKSEKKRYLLDNSKYIFQYFEQKQQISSGTTENHNKNVLNSFFKIKSKTPDAENIQSEKYVKSKNMYQNYWRNVNHEINNIQDFIVSSDICESCKSGELIPQDEEGILICNNMACGKFITYIVDSSKPTNKEPPNEVSYTLIYALIILKRSYHNSRQRKLRKSPKRLLMPLRQGLRRSA